ncbi:superfamily II DNA/RNA helicase [Anopheles sinensis]|uniref:Superfamily II DNA/RNA helicase n=1 Tax=Anopheles sinensis TaxID=74873 RepID=A0A084WPM6_ANOSI|nr:superfamily II DNA/RNA helicase [Anopheles sinensis]
MPRGGNLVRTKLAATSQSTNETDDLAAKVLAGLNNRAKKRQEPTNTATTNNNFSVGEGGEN